MLAISKPMIQLPWFFLTFPQLMNTTGLPKKIYMHFNDNFYFIWYYFMKLAGFWQMTQLCALVAFTFSPNKSPTNRIWPPLGDWPLWPNHVRYRNVWYLVGKIIHRAIFSQKLRFLPWSSDALIAIKVRGQKRPPGFQRSKKPGAHRVKSEVIKHYQ